MPSRPNSNASLYLEAIDEVTDATMYVRHLEQKLALARKRLQLAEKQKGELGARLLQQMTDGKAGQSESPTIEIQVPGIKHIRQAMEESVKRVVRAVGPDGATDDMGI